MCSRLCLKIVLGIPVTVIEKRGGGVDEGRVRERERERGWGWVREREREREG